MLKKTKKMILFLKNDKLELFKTIFPYFKKLLPKPFSSFDSTEYRFFVSHFTKTFTRSLSFQTNYIMKGNTREKTLF